MALLITFPRFNHLIPNLITFIISIRPLTMLIFYSYLHSFELIFFVYVFISCLIFGQHIWLDRHLITIQIMILIFSFTLLLSFLFHYFYLLIFVDSVLFFSSIFYSFYLPYPSFTFTSHQVLLLHQFHYLSIYYICLHFLLRFTILFYF